MSYAGEFTRFGQLFEIFFNLQIQKRIVVATIIHENVRYDFYSAKLYNTYNVFSSER